jgi:hypothetical protein
MHYVLSPQARRNAIEAIRTAPDGWSVTVKPATRSLAENAMLHALLTQISKQVEWAGQKRDIETWKRLLTAAWTRARGEHVEMLPALDGHGVDIVFRRTSNLTRGECAELIEFVLAWAAEHGVGEVDLSTGEIVAARKTK